MVVRNDNANGLYDHYADQILPFYLNTPGLGIDSIILSHLLCFNFHKPHMCGVIN